MSLNPNQMAYVAIVSTLIFGSIFVGVSGVLQTSEGLGNFDSAVEEDIAGDGIATNKGEDTDDDGLSDVLEETQYGTDPLNEDTDGDGMSDGWEVEHGLNPLDDGESDPLEQDPGESLTLKRRSRKMKRTLGQIPTKVLMATQTMMV